MVLAWYSTLGICVFATTPLFIQLWSRVTRLVPGWFAHYSTYIADLPMMLTMLHTRPWKGSCHRIPVRHTNSMDARSSNDFQIMGGLGWLSVACMIKLQCNSMEWIAWNVAVWMVHATVHVYVLEYTVYRYSSTGADAKYYGVPVAATRIDITIDSPETGDRPSINNQSSQ